MRMNWTALVRNALTFYLNYKISMSRNEILETATIIVQLLFKLIKLPWNLRPPSRDCSGLHRFKEIIEGLEVELE